MTCGFSRVTGKSRVSSWAKLSRGASVPEVSRMQRTPSAHSCAMATPGSKHQYDSVGTSCPPARIMLACAERPMLPDQVS